LLPKSVPTTLVSSQTKTGENQRNPKSVIARETSHDYEAFLEGAKKEAEKKEKAMLKSAKDAEQRRREFNMDPWASKW